MTFWRCVLLGAVSFAVAESPRGLGQSPGKNRHEPLPDGALWRLGTMRMRHLGEVQQIGFTADGKHIASLGGDHAFSLWDLKTGFEARRLLLSNKVLPA